VGGAIEQAGQDMQKEAQDAARPGEQAN
jgi:hypothetical protein